MFDNIINKFKNKNIAILGFGREGRSSYNFLRSYLKDEKITIVDKNISIKDDQIFKNDKNINFKLGPDYLNDLEQFDIILKTAGISLNHIDNTKFIKKVVSQYSLVLEETNLEVIGITGTKGKSTTSSLIYKVLKDCGKKALLLGNIGNPVFDYINEIEEDTILVFELSAYQLEYIKKAPHISILLNLYEEHLDYFNTLDKYYNAKLNILNKQSENDYGFYLDKIKRYIKPSMKSKLFNIGKDLYIKDNYIYFNDKKIYNIDDERYLLGEHNLTNIMFVLGVCSIYNLDMKKVAKSINSFKGLEHRMEYVGKYSDINFYNDTIATIPEATINAIVTLKDVDTLIFGGMDRGIDYKLLIDYLCNCNINNFICMPETGYKIGKIIEEKTNKKVYYLEELNEVVDLAKRITKKDKICLLSPSAPSYNKYKNFEEKGKIYKECVKRD